MVYRKKKSPRRRCRGLRKTYHVTELRLMLKRHVTSKFIKIYYCYYKDDDKIYDFKKLSHLLTISSVQLYLFLSHHN